MNAKRLFFPLILLGIFFMFPSCGPQETTEEKAEEEKNLPEIAVLTGEGFQDAEAYMPIGYFTNRGAKITVIGMETGTVGAYNSDFTIKIEKTVDEVAVDDFDALIFPGGHAPEKLREDDDVVAFARDFFNSGKPTAAICHGPQVLVTADVLEGRTSSGVGSIEEEIEEADGTYVDEEISVDGNYISSRVPKDLSAFCGAIHDALKDEGFYQ
ncbi:MAG: type 1 glutamine amidotransferase [Bacteroidales bacterium]|nr:type 1 glutamine amidotransferase [Bacteroidales bacterium]MBS3776048.1 type 1 glutamine amidotransferase [Bacteroidales bacterium]